MCDERSNFRLSLLLEVGVVLLVSVISEALILCVAMLLSVGCLFTYDLTGCLGGERNTYLHPNVMSFVASGSTAAIISPST